MILTRSALSSLAHIPSDDHTHTHTRHVGADLVEERYHMPPLGDSTLETRVEGIAGEEREDIGLAGKSRVGAIVLHEGLEAGDPADRLCRSRP